MSYDANKPGGSDALGIGDETLREQFRAIKEDKIVDAGYFQGYSPGNTAGSIPISNGLLNTNLNSEYLNGQLASYYLNATNINAGTLSTSRFPTIPVSKGGTNITAYNAGDMLYASASTTFARLAKGTSLQQLRMNAGATAPEWYTPASTLPLAGGTMQGAINMGSFSISGLSEPVDPQDAATMNYVDISVSQISTPETVAVEQSINSFNDSPETTSIFDVSGGDLINNKIKAGVKFCTLIEGIKHIYYLIEDVPIPSLEVTKLYFIALKVKDESKYKSDLTASDVEVVLLNQPMLWKNSAVNVSTRLNNIVMTSNSQGGYVVSASTQESGNSAYKANNGDVGQGDGWKATSNTGWWKIQLPAAKLCNRYKIAPYKSTDGVTPYGPKTWTFEGSNDNTNWTVLDTQTGITGWALYTYKTFYTKAATNYLYYRINVTAASSSTVLAIGDLQFYNDSTVMAVSENLELQTDGSTITDKWGNIITLLGNPTISNGKLVCDGTGDGLKVSSILCLGNEKWVIATKVKFNTTNTQVTVFRSEASYCLSLQRETTNKLQLYLSSNGTSWNIASTLIGTKADWNTTSEYYIRIVWIGTQYLVQWSTDSTDGINGTWVTDITVTSSLALYLATALTFGCKYDGTSSLNGTLDIASTKVCVGNSYFNNLGRFSFNGENVYIGYPGDYTPSNAIAAIMLGELRTTSTQVGDNITYAFNNRYVSEVLVGTSTATLNTQDNIGTTEKFVKIRRRYNESYQWTYNDKSGSGTVYYGFAPTVKDRNNSSAEIGTSNAYTGHGNVDGLNSFPASNCTTCQLQLLIERV